MNTVDTLPPPIVNDLNSQGIIWVVIALSISMFPQLLSMPVNLVPITLLPIGWRLLAEKRGWRPIHMLWRILATAVAISALILTYGSLIGRRTAVSLLVVMLSLKLLETFRVRDARIVASLSLFLCATQFLFTQGIPMIFYMAACLLSALISLMYLQRQEAFENLGAVPETGFNLFSDLGFQVRLLALALPIGIALFLLFPRWGSPLWGVPEEALDARSGLSNSMSPGDIQNLFMDDSPAFRVQFDGVIPRHSNLYWRGPVFWDFDGRTWKSGFFSRNLRARHHPRPAQALFHYTVQIEPTEQHWLFALDYPATVPDDSFLSLDYQLLANQPITQLHSYTISSDPDFTDSPELQQTLRRSALQLPAGFNPRTASMIAAWRAETPGDAAIVQRALAYFNQQQFHYTLNPPVLSSNTVDEFLFNTRKGFCEHYASAFTVMMRMAGIPARVVTGYQGGWYSDLGSYVLVRQSDAHAWSEVWLRGSGWTRIDPTAAVAPQRVEQGAIGSLAQRRHLLDFEWLRNARNTFDLLKKGWNSWVIAFDSAHQSRLFTLFGWGIFDATKLVIALITAILVAVAGVVLLMPMVMRYRASRQQDPSVRLWHKFIGRLQKAGATAPPSMGPGELAVLAGGQLKQAAAEIHRIAELYTQCRYSPHGGDLAALELLIKHFHPRAA